MTALGLLFALLYIVCRRIALFFYDPWEEMVSGDIPNARVIAILLSWAFAIAAGVMFILAAWKSLP